MIIRSQDKERITSDLNLSIYAEDFDCFPIENHRGMEMGVYSTKEKAIKVLDMICEHYQECKMCESGRRQIAQVEFVFQIPQDSEV